MLVVKIHNDGTGTEDSSNYDCEVLVTVNPTRLKEIAFKHITGHKRGDGWRVLLKRLADEGIDIP